MHAPGTQDLIRRPARRWLLRRAAALAAVGGVSLLVACQGTPETIVVTPRATQATAVPAATQPPAPTTVAAPAPAAPPAATQQTAAAPTTAPVDQPVAIAPELSVAMRAMYQMDAQHSGRSPFAGPSDPAPVRSFDSTQIPTEAPGDPRPEIQSSAAIAPDGTIFIGTFPGNLLALRDPGMGEQLELLWHFHPAGASSFHTTPAIGADGTVYAGFSTGGATPEARGTFYALQPPMSPQSEPAVRWSLDLGPGRQTSSPTIGPDGTIYVTSGAGVLFAVDPSGVVRWQITTGPSLKSAPALGADGTVYVASMNGSLYAVAPPSTTAAEPTVRWSFSFAAFPGNGPAVTATAPPPGADGIGSGASATIAPDGTIFIGANNSNLYAINPDGSLKWIFEAEREVGGIWTTAVLSPDARVLYFGANKGGLYAVDTTEGSIVWHHPIFGSVYSSPTLGANGVLYTGSTAGHLIAVDAATSQQVWDWTNTSGAPIWTAPALRADGTILVGDTQGKIILVGEADALRAAQAN